MSNKTIDILNKKFKESILFSEEKNALFIQNPEKWNDVANYLFDNKDLKFDYGQRGLERHRFDNSEKTINEVLFH